MQRALSRPWSIKAVCSTDRHLKASVRLGLMGMRYWRRTIAIITLVIRDVERKHLMLVAAGLAYYFLMSLFPALVLLTAGAAYLPLQDGLQGMTLFLAHVIAPQGISIIERLLATISPHRSGLLSFGIIATLWLASIGGKGVIASLDIV